MQPINFAMSLVTIYSCSYLLTRTVKQTFVLASISKEPLMPVVCLLYTMGCMYGIIIGLNSLLLSTK